MTEQYNDINQLLVKYLLGESNGDEEREVEVWIAASASNKKYFHDFRLIWEESKNLASESDINAEDAWNRFQHKLRQPMARPVPVKEINHRLYWTRIAAMLTVIVTAALIFYIFQNGRPSQTITVASKSNVVKDTLPDGSLVTLNKNSLISYPQKFKGDTRKIALKGEAFFNVTPDKDHPFIIQANDVLVKVVGTSFNVRMSNGKTEVIVETGIVQVIRNQKVVEVKPKEKATVLGRDTAMVKEKVADKFYDYYRSQEFVCDNTPLWKLVEVLNEAYDANIIIERKSVAKLQINTTFYNQSLDQILEVIKETFGLSVVKNGNSIILE